MPQMHEGVTKLIVKIWFKKTKGLLFKHIKNLNQYLCNCKPPSFVAKLDSFERVRAYKGIEMYHFVAYYGVPMLYKLKQETNAVSQDMFDNFCNYVEGLRIVCSQRTTRGKLATAKTKFKLFSGKKGSRYV